MSLSTRSAAFVVAAAGLLCLTPAGYAQAPAAPAAPAATQAGQPAQPPPVVSPEVTADRHITFRIYAPKAQVVRLSRRAISRASGKGAGHQGRERRLGSHGRSSRARRVPLQLQRRRRDDDRSAQARSSASRTSNAGAWSTCRAPTSLDTRNVPHGAVAAVTYYSTALRRSAGCTSTRRRATRRARTSTRSSICCTAPATATTRGRRSAAPASSSTT